MPMTLDVELRARFDWSAKTAEVQTVYKGFQIRLVRDITKNSYLGL